VYQTSLKIATVVKWRFSSRMSWLNLKKNTNTMKKISLPQLC